MSKVAVARCDRYERDEVESAVDRLFQCLGVDSSWFPEGNVLVKPNLLSPEPPSRAVTTHPLVVEVILRKAGELGLDVFCGDSPGRGDTGAVFRTTGIWEACQRAGARLMDFSEGVPVKWKSGRYCKEFVLARAVVEHPAIINVAKMKTHGLMGFTGAVKNLLGCVSGSEKGAMHLRFRDPSLFANMLLDLYEAVSPRLSVIDGVVGMEGEGPSHGHPRHVGLLMASQDAVALDAVALTLLGQDPMSLPLTSRASDLGVGEPDPANVTVVGDSLDGFPLEDFVMPDMGRGTVATLSRIGGLVGNRLARRPVVDENLCTGCGECKKACPAGAVTLSPSSAKARIDDSACIRCYCCQEMCPRGAVILKHGPVSRLARRAVDWLTR